jgi:hypothetical protein
LILALYHLLVKEKYFTLEQFTGSSGKSQLFHQKNSNIEKKKERKIKARGGILVKKDFRQLFNRQRFEEELAEEIAKDLKKNKPNSSDTGNNRR